MVDSSDIQPTSLRLRSREYQKLSAAAALIGMRLSSFIRDAALKAADEELKKRASSCVLATTVTPADHALVDAVARSAGFEGPDDFVRELVLNTVSTRVAEVKRLAGVG